MSSLWHRQKCGLRDAAVFTMRRKRVTKAQGEGEGEGEGVIAIAAAGSANRAENFTMAIRAAGIVG